MAYMITYVYTIGQVVNGYMYVHMVVSPSRETPI